MIPLKAWLYGGAALAALALLAYVSSSIYKAGKDEVYDSLKDDKITILREGQNVDKRVFGADDDAMFCMLVDCSMPDGATEPN